MKHHFEDKVYVKFRNQQCLAIVLEFVKDFCYAGGYHLLITFKEMANGIEKVMTVSTKDYGDGLPIDDRYITRHPLWVDMGAMHVKLGAFIETVQKWTCELNNSLAKNIDSKKITSALMRPEAITKRKNLKEDFYKEIAKVLNHCDTFNEPFPEVIAQDKLDFESTMAMFLGTVERITAGRSQVKKTYFQQAAKNKVFKAKTPNPVSKAQAIYRSKKDVPKLSKAAPRGRFTTSQKRFSRTK